MGIVEQTLNNYIWDNLNELKSMFSDRLYSSLLKKKEKEDREGFTETLELIVDLDSDFFDKIKNRYLKNLSIDEVSELLYTKPYDNFVERAEYWVENYNKNDEKYALLLNNFGRVYTILAHYEKAEPLYEKALKIREEVLGENHPDTATSANNLAALYILKGEYKKAEPLYKKALKTREDVLGKNHPDTASIYNNLANLYELKGEYKKAELFYEKALKMGENNFIHLDIDNFMQDLNKLFFLNSRNSNVRLKIDSLKIKNFKQYKKLFSIDFSDQVNIVVGQNAMGKTTLLQAITLGLLKQNLFDARKLDYDKYITKNENESEIIIGYDGGREKLVKIKKDDRAIESNYFIPFVLAYGSNFFTKYNLSVDEIVEDILNETIHKDIATSIFEDHVDEFWNPLTILSELDKSSHSKGEEKRAILFDTITNFLDGYFLIKDDKSGRYFFQKENDYTQLQLEDLSEGYRGNVLLITDMVVKILGVGWTPKTIEGIILIDEFDKHLHPKWQSKLVNQLTKTFPKIQFIMTTHNPMSILDRNPDEITILKEIDGEIVAEKKSGTKNIDVSIVLLEYFELNSLVGNDMQEKVEKLFELKDRRENGNFSEEDKKQLKLIENELDGTMASRFIYDRAYFRFLTFVKENENIDFSGLKQLNKQDFNSLLEKYKAKF